MSRLCMKEISRALIEMISDESPYASKDMLCGARGAFSVRYLFFIIRAL